jgi:hypothetical protein
VPGASTVLEPGIVRPDESVARGPDGSVTDRSLPWIEVVGVRTDGVGELDTGAGAVPGATESIAFPESSPWIGPGGFPPGFDARESPSPLDPMVLQGEPPDPSPARGLNRPRSGSWTISPWMRGDVPADGMEWVKMGLAVASEIGS